MNIREAIYPAVTILVVMFLFYLRFYNVYTKKSLSKEAKAFADKAYNLFVINDKNDAIYAICTHTDFEIAFNRFQEVCEGCPTEKLKRHNFIYAIPIFTFIMNKTGKTGNHAGNYYHCNDLVNEIIEIITGVHPRDMLNKDYIYVRDRIFVPDHRLFIPYSSGINPKIRQQERKVYKNNNLRSAYNYLIEAALYEKERITSHAQR